MRGVATGFPDSASTPPTNCLTYFAAGPARYREAIAGLSDAALRTQPRGLEKWSIHTIILHSADSEMQGAFRIRKTWANLGETWGPRLTEDALF